LLDANYVERLSKVTIMRRFMFASTLIGLAFNCAGAAAEDWPGRPVTMVVPFGAGSGTDILGRVISPRLSEILGRQVVVENIPGAGGMNGSARVAKGPADGYQFVLGNVGTHAQNQTLYKSPLYNAISDFEPVGLVADLPPVLLTRADFPANSLQEFAAYAKSNQDKLQYGSSGAGSAAQLGCSLLNSVLGLKVTHVPYRGAAPAMQDLVAGRIDYQCALLPAPLTQIESKQVKAMAILIRARSPVLPLLQTADEQGIKDFDASAWHAVFMTKGTPPEVVKKLNEAVSATLDTPTVAERLTQLGAIVVPAGRRSSVYLKAFMATETDKWGATIRNANMQLD
jgi:tripartite-type tricarboxylate transporter receptor subunit TctC